MKQYIIKGGKPLHGEVTISGAKNSALGIIAAAIMANEPVVIENLPEVGDIRVMLDAIEGIGAVVDRIDAHTARINGALVGDACVDYDCIRKIRGSYYLLGALLGKYGHAKVALPGGCEMGSRPIDQHIKGFELLGAEVKIEHGDIEVTAEHLKGNHIYLDCPSVGATINIMMAASLAEGKTVIENPAKEPHVVDAANFLNSMGADIKGAGTDVIRIRGVEALHGSEYSIIQDQIEAGTYMMAAAITGGDVLIKNVIPKHLDVISAKLIEIGATVEEYDDAVRVKVDKRLGYTNIKTLPYPGFPTDMQPQMGALLSLSEGTSVITETLFENRFKYTAELCRMGANITVEGTTAIVNGVEKLQGAAVSAPDLRAGAALVIAALAADGFSFIDSIHYIERGYENFSEKIKALGGEIEKIDLNDDRAVQKFKLRVG